MRTQEEIDYQVQGILEERQTTPEKDFWGRNVWDMADAKVAVLRGVSTSADYEEGGYDLNTVNAALDAEVWLNNVEPDNLFEEC